jgi:hypothetical protein
MPTKSNKKDEDRRKESGLTTLREWRKRLDMAPVADRQGCFSISSFFTFFWFLFSTLFFFVLSTVAAIFQMG